MKKRFLALILTFVFMLTLIPAIPIVQAADSVNVKVLVEPSLDFDYVMSFSEGLAAVGKDGKYGYIDKTGKIVIPLEYDWAENFSEGLAAVKKTGVGYGYIDKTGKVVIPFNENYHTALEFNEGYAAIATWGAIGYFYIDKTGAEVIPPAGGYIDGSLVFGYNFGGPFSGGLAVILQTDVDDTTKMNAGFIDKTGAFVIPMEYDSAAAFKDGFARVLIGTWTDGKYGFIDTTGKVVIPIEYEGYDNNNDKGDFHDGLARVKKDGKYGFIDKTGKVMIPLKYDNANSFSDGLAYVRSYGDSYTEGYIDTTGKMVLSLSEEYSGGNDFHDGFASVGKSGEPVYNEEYDYYSNTYKFGYIDKTGKAATSFEYDRAEDFSEGLAWVQKDDKWGILEITTGASVVKPEEPAQTSKPATANPSSQKVLVNGVEVPFDAYNINGNNYFKLRDLAFVLDGTEKQFEVGYDNATKAITLASGKPYTKAGGEMVLKENRVKKTVNPTQSKIYLDGKEVQFAAYIIDGNNYFKLRDVMQAFDVYVGYDDATKTITLDTSKGYTE